MARGEPAEINAIRVVPTNSNGAIISLFRFLPNVYFGKTLKISPPEKLYVRIV